MVFYLSLNLILSLIFHNFHKIDSFFMEINNDRYLILCTNQLASYTLQILKYFFGNTLVSQNGIAEDFPLFPCLRHTEIHQSNDISYEEHGFG